MKPEQIAELLDNRTVPHPRRRSVFIRRYLCSRSTAGKEIRVRENCGFAAVIVPDSPAVRELLPARFRDAKECILLYCHLDLTAGKPVMTRSWYLADRIDTYDGRFWRVVWSRDWNAYGFTQAVAVRTHRSFWEREREEDGRSDPRESRGRRRSGLILPPVCRQKNSGSE